MLHEHESSFLLCEEEKCITYVIKPIQKMFRTWDFPVREAWPFGQGELHRSSHLSCEVGSILSIQMKFEFFCKIYLKNTKIILQDMFKLINN